MADLYRSGGANTSKKYEIPLIKFEYSYIESCKDVKELEKILKVLRSGSEGSFPNLETLAESRIHHLDPSSRVLRKEKPIRSASDLPPGEKEDVNGDMESFLADMTQADANLKHKHKTDVTHTPAAPIRETGNINKNSDKKKKKNKSPKPRDHAEWDKMNFDAMEKETNDEKVTSDKSTNHSEVEAELDVQGKSPMEKERLANMEKDKGNEYFTAGDYDMAITYYTRSISLLSLPAFYNNRALAYLKQKNYPRAISDCQNVLDRDPDNVKALLRRGSAHQAQNQYTKAINDFERVLDLEPQNQRAGKLLNETRNTWKTKGKKLLIDEVDGDGEDEDDQRSVNFQNQRLMTNGLPGSVTAEPCAGTSGWKPSTSAQRPSTSAQSSSSSAQMLSTSAQSSSASAQSSSASAQIPSTSAQRPPSSTQSRRVLIDETDSSDDEISAVTDRQGGKADAKQLDVPDPQPLTEPMKPEPKTAESTTGEEKIVELAATESTTAGPITSESTAADDSMSTCSEGATVSTDVSCDGCAPRVGADLTDSADTDHSLNSSPEHEIAPPQRQRPVFATYDLPTYAVSLKETGNAAFKCGQYAEALNYYTRIIEKLTKAKNFNEQLVNIATIYSNRAACHYKIGDCKSCIADCGKSLELLPHSVKPLLRRAQAYEACEKYREAYSDYTHVLSLCSQIQSADSNQNTALQGLYRCQIPLQNTYNREWRTRVEKVNVNILDIPVLVPACDLDAATSTNSNLNTKLIVPDSKSASAKNKTSKVETATPSEKVAESKTKVTNGNVSESSSTPATNDKDVKVDEQPIEHVTDHATKCAPKAKLKDLSDNETKFNKLKAEGNKLVGKESYRQALDVYNKCLNIYSDRCAIYTNRALCYLKLNQLGNVIMDCDKALQLEPDNVKAFFRKAQAKKCQRDYRGSMQDLLQVLRLDSKNGAAKKELDVVKPLYKSQLDEEKRKQMLEKEKAEIEKKKLLIEQISAQVQKLTAQKDMAEKEKKKLLNEEISEQETSKVQSKKRKKNKNSGGKKSGNDTDQSATDSVSHQSATEKKKADQSATDKTKADQSATDMKKADQSATEKKKSGQSATKKNKTNKTASEKISSQLGASATSQTTNQSAPATSQTTNQSAPATSQTTNKTPQIPQPQLSNKVTPYEFTQAWNGLKSSEEMQPYAALMDRISPHQLGKLLGNKLDASMLSVILHIIHDFTVKTDLKRSYQLLHHLSRVERFDMNSMFMADADKDLVRGVIDKLETGQTPYSKTDLEKLRKAYKV